MTSQPTAAGAAGFRGVSFYDPAPFVSPQRRSKVVPKIAFVLFYRNFPSVLRRCWLGNRKDIRPVKSRVLVCCWSRLDWSFARPVAPVVTTTSIILSSSKKTS